MKTTFLLCDSSKFVVSKNKGRFENFNVLNHHIDVILPLTELYIVQNYFLTRDGLRIVVARVTELGLLQQLKIAREVVTPLAAS
jgi:hypothetical protein